MKFIKKTVRHSQGKYYLGEILINRKETPDKLRVTKGEIPIISKIGFREAEIELRHDRVSNTKLISVKPNDLVISGINVEKGAVAINGFNKQIAATIHYSAYYPIEEIVSLKYLWFFLRSHEFKFYLKQSFPSGIKTEIKPEKFLSIQIPIPPLPEQIRIVSKIESVKNRIDKIKSLRAGQTKDINNLLYSKYTDLIEAANWSPMKEVAPIIRRVVKLKDEELYPELGIRSFGKGTFHKPALTGLEVGTKKIFQIKKGDLVFSNVFAWEGGIAVAKDEDDNRFGSHRFISCVVDQELILAEFLGFHFLSPKGLEDINACSPGGAGRNKTLGLDKLMKIKVPVPGITLQKEFVDLLHKINFIKEQHSNTDKELTQLMPALLDKAFKGEL